MRKITAFVFISLDGFYKSLNEDISWHDHGEEGLEFSETQMKKDTILLFGRKTYEMMNRFWPTEEAQEKLPKIARGMNNSKKIVVSRTLKNATWKNTTIFDSFEQLEAFKGTQGKDITILGSGTLVKELTNRSLIDEYELLVDPLALGSGVSLFQGINRNLHMDVLNCKTFKKSGAVLLHYKIKK